MNRSISARVRNGECVTFATTQTHNIYLRLGKRGLNTEWVVYTYNIDGYLKDEIERKGRTLGAQVVVDEWGKGHFDIALYFSAFSLEVAISFAEGIAGGS